VALPVTHRPPEDAAVAAEVPQAVKQQIGFDLERSWVVVNEGNQFGSRCLAAMNSTTGFCRPVFSITF
jgi:hypothetical protein